VLRINLSHPEPYSGKAPTPIHKKVVAPPGRGLFYDTITKSPLLGGVAKPGWVHLPTPLITPTGKIIDFVPDLKVEYLSEKPTIY